MLQVSKRTRGKSKLSVVISHIQYNRVVYELHPDRTPFAVTWQKQVLYLPL